MATPYNQFSGQSLERLAALSDGVFAVAMTLLVLDLHIPLPESVHSEGELRHALMSLAPHIIPYVMSFLTLGIFWVGQQTQLNHFTSSDRNLTWLNLVFLFIVTLQPFSTTLLAEFINYRSAIVVYWLNILLLGAMLYTCLLYAARAGLLNAQGVQMMKHFKARILIAQSLYAFGALLCIFSAYLSIALILLVQLNYVIAPPITCKAFRLRK